MTKEYICSRVYCYTIIMAMRNITRHIKNIFIPQAGNEYRPHALRQKSLHITSGVVVVAKIIAIIAVSIYASVARVSDITPTTIISLTNQARTANKVTALKTNTLLTKAAQAKANDMVQRQYFAHVSPTGTTPWAWFKQAGYSYTYAGENLALDYISAEDVTAAWLNSPSHRANLLSSKYKDIGVAVVTGTINGSSSLIVVQEFGAPTPPVKKIVTVPAQTPTASVAVKKAATVTPTPPQEKVLGATVVLPPTPPTVPTILTPDDASLVRVNEPDVIGNAEPGSVVTLFVNGARTASITTDAAGVYDIRPTLPLADGEVSFQVGARARGLDGGLSVARQVTIDTQPPTVNLQSSTILLSYLVPGQYDVAASVSGNPSSVIVRDGTSSVALKPKDALYVGSVRVANDQVPGMILLEAHDSAKNSTSDVLVDPNNFTIGVVAASGGPFVSMLRVIFFSRVFLMTILSLLFIIASMNVLMEWRHQHRLVVVHSLLVLFLIGTMLVV